MKHHRWNLWSMVGVVALGLLIAGTPVIAEGRSKAAAALTQTDSFLSAHPDLRWRSQGVKRYASGKFESAMMNFKRAARFADKPSAAMVGEMYFHGEGVALDRALGYAWMDLACERGYRDLIGRRDAFWNLLDAAERERAAKLAGPLKDEYGDAVAQPRMAHALRRARAQITGSRTGAVGALTMNISTGNGTFMSIDGSQYYASKYWEPKEYFSWQDQTWADLPRANVDVGEVEKATDINQSEAQKK